MALVGLEKTCSRWVGVSNGSFLLPKRGLHRRQSQLFSGMHSKRTKANCHKLQLGKFLLNSNKTLFTMRVIKCCKRLARLCVISILGNFQNSNGHFSVQPDITLHLALV